MIVSSACDNMQSSGFVNNSICNIENALNTTGVHNINDMFSDQTFN